MQNFPFNLRVAFTKNSQEIYNIYQTFKYQDQVWDFNSVKRSLYAGHTKIFPIDLQYLPKISQVWDFDNDRCKTYLGITKIFPINLLYLPNISQVWDFDSDRCKMYVGITKIFPINL